MCDTSKTWTKWSNENGHLCDTPRTMAALEWVRPMGDDSGPPHEQYVPAEEMAKLERENAALRAKLADAHRTMDELVTDANAITLAQSLQRKCAELDQLRADKARLDWLEAQDCWIGLMGEYDVSPRIAAGGAYAQSVRATIDAAMEGKQ